MNLNQEHDYELFALPHAQGKQHEYSVAQQIMEHRGEKSPPGLRTQQNLCVSVFHCFYLEGETLQKLWSKKLKLVILWRHQYK
jgi:hypothetical protein